MKKLFGTVVITTVIIGSAWFFLGEYSWQTDTQVPVDPETHLGAGTEPETISDTHTGEQPEEIDTRGRARRITIVPDNNLQNARPHRKIDVDSQASVKKMVESALDGDIAVSIDLGQLVNRCSDHSGNEEHIRRRLQSASQNLSAKTSFLFPNGESRRFVNFEEYEAYIWSEFDQCQVIKTIAEDDLHELITQMADNGHVIARYLYAMWRPESSPYPDTQNMLDWIEYQDKALEYTLQNLDGGEPLGLLALAQSYRNINPGFFTPHQGQFYRAFFLASRKCGLRSAWLDSTIDQRMEILSKEGIDRVEDQSDELKELFCGGNHMPMSDK